jgi:hypothetical protein
VLHPVCPAYAEAQEKPLVYRELQPFPFAEPRCDRSCVPACVFFWQGVMDTHNYVDWRLVPSEGGWHKRRKHGTVVYKDSLLIIGGFYCGVGVSINLNDVWKSADGGETWTRCEFSCGRLTTGGAAGLILVLAIHCAQCASRRRGRAGMGTPSWC